MESDKHQRIPVLESRETVVPKSRLLDKSLDGKLSYIGEGGEENAHLTFQIANFLLIHRVCRGVKCYVWSSLSAKQPLRLLWLTFILVLCSKYQ